MIKTILLVGDEGVSDADRVSIVWSCVVGCTLESSRKIMSLQVYVVLSCLISVQSWTDAKFYSSAYLENIFNFFR